MTEKIRKTDQEWQHELDSDRYATVTPARNRTAIAAKMAQPWRWSRAIFP